MVTLIFLFIFAYGCIMFEHKLHIDKAIPALVGGMLMWAYLAYMGLPLVGGVTAEKAIEHHTGNIAGIIFFVIGAMAIVNALLQRGSFDKFKDWIRTKNQTKLMWATTGIAFFLSAVLDNLTTTIVMIAILNTLIERRGDRMAFGVLLIIAANAGGAWSPIGDITTTMLWIDGKVTTGALITHVFVPSVVQAMFIPLVFTFAPKRLDKLTEGIVELMPDDVKKDDVREKDHDGKTFMLIFGVSALIFVPIFKVITHLPPFVGMLFSAGAVLLANEYFNRHARKKEKDSISFHHLLAKVEWNAVLFFLGILIAVSAFESVATPSGVGMLQAAAEALQNTGVMPLEVFGIVLGVFSAVIDNIPLVFASIGMFSDLPQDHWFWHFIAYTAGTGGSILIIGSAAGVIAMSMLKIEFFWYMRRFSFLILVSYLVGAGVFLLQRSVL